LTGVVTLVDIMRLKEQGLSRRAVARRLGLSRATVSKYWDVTPTGLTPPTGYKRRAQLGAAYRDYITGRLEEYPELSACRLYKELVKRGYQGSERSVRRQVRAIRPSKQRAYKPYETLPGEQAQVDWGHFGTILVDGVRYKLYAFVFTLCWSRVTYVEFVIRLDLATFLSCMHRACEYMGGVPREMLFDNAKVVVSERVGKVVRFTEDLMHFALAYGFTPRACWTYDAETKGKVEAQVKFVRRGFFYGSKFAALQDLNQRVSQWCSEEANTRIHGTTRAVPAAQLQHEQGHLKALPARLGMPFVIEERKKTRTSLISVDNNYYSVPSDWTEKKVRFRRFEGHLELLDADRVVDTIPLAYGRGQRIIRDEHYPQHQRAQQRKTPAHPLQARFEALAPEAPAYLAGLSSSRVGTLRDQMESIVALGELHPSAAISQAMQRALAFQSFGYGTLKRILARQATSPESLPEVPAEVHTLPETWNVQVEQRNPAYYQVMGGAK